MTTLAEAGQITGTENAEYDLIWYLEHCLSNALRLQTFIDDAELAGDSEVAELFRKAQADSRKGAQRAKALLVSRLA
jgi:signal-transduction protein with cAMP-binding, CBS, and nucleotidyltransferase domain